MGKFSGVRGAANKGIAKAAGAGSKGAGKIAKGIEKRQTSKARSATIAKSKAKYDAPKPPKPSKPKKPKKNDLVGGKKPNKNANKRGLPAAGKSSNVPTAGFSTAQKKANVSQRTKSGVSGAAAKAAAPFKKAASPAKGGFRAGRSGVTSSQLKASGNPGKRMKAGRVVGANPGKSAAGAGAVTVGGGGTVAYNRKSKSGKTVSVRRKK